MGAADLARILLVRRCCRDAVLLELRLVRSVLEAQPVDSLARTLPCQLRARTPEHTAGLGAAPAVLGPC